MKKYSTTIYVSLIIITLASGFFIYNVFGKNKSENEEKSKALAGIKQLENKFVDLFNDLNNISFENYKIFESETNTKSNNNSQGESEETKSDNQQSKTSGDSENNSNSVEQNSTSQEQNKKYSLESSGILTGNLDPDWNKIKNDVENMYAFLYSNFIDLYKSERNQDYLVNFNKEFDNLTRYVKEENKEESLAELSILYDYLPYFVENCTDSEKEIIIIRTKDYIFKAYSNLEQNDWDTISENINNATTEFTKLVTNINNNENLNQYNVNKAYVMINELQNAVNLKDKEVFLIKYKNLLEELKNI